MAEIPLGKREFETKCRHFVGINQPVGINRLTYLTNHPAKKSMLLLNFAVVARKKTINL